MDQMDAKYNHTIVPPMWVHDQSFKLIRFLSYHEDETGTDGHTDSLKTKSSVGSSIEIMQ